MIRASRLTTQVVFVFLLQVGAASAQTFTSTDTPIPIPPTGTSGITISNITVGGVGTLSDVEVNVDYSHSFNGDLIATVESPSGTTVTLFSSVGGADDANGAYLFSDSATSPFNPSVPGTYMPEQPLSAFVGEDPNGTWTLSINDQFAGDMGNLDFWQLLLKTNMLTDAAGAGIVPTLPLVELQSNSRFLETLARRFRNGGNTDPHGPFAQVAPRGSRFGMASDGIQLASHESTDGPLGDENFVVRGQDCCCPNNRRAWLVGYGADGQFDSSFDYDFGGFAAGVEHVFDSNAVAGFAVNYSASNVDGSSSGSNTDSWGFALFGNRHFDPGYLTAVVAYNHSDYNTQRQTMTGSAVGDFTGHSFLSLVEVGTCLQLAEWRATPHLGAQYIHISLDSFEETGAGASNLRFGDDNLDSTRLIAGLDATRCFYGFGCAVTPVLRAAYIQELSGDNRVIAPAFVGGGGPFAVSGAELGNEFGDVGVGATVVAGSNLTLYADYDFQFTQTHTQHLFGGGMSLNW